MLKTKLFILTIGLYCFNVNNANTQAIFNKLYDFGLIQHNGFSLIEHDGIYYVAGQGLPDIEPLEHTTFFMSVDVSGNLINYALLDDGPDNTFLTFNNVGVELVVLKDHIYSTAVNIGTSYIQKTDLNVDSVELIHTFVDPENEGINPISVANTEFPPGYFSTIGLTAYFIDQDSTEKMRRVIITRLDPNNENTLEQFYYQVSGEDLTPHETVIDSKGNLVILGGTGDKGLFAMKINQDMEMIDFKKHDGEWSGTYLESVITDQDEIYFTQTETRREFIVTEARPYILKMNSDLDLVWSKILIQQEFKNGSLVVTGMAETHEKDGVIVSTSNFDLEEGLVARLDVNGDVVWQKIIPPILNVDSDMELYTTIATSDGYYMSVGNNFTETFHDTIGSWSQAWLVKYDGDGNIVQDGLSSVNADFSDQISIYPNPSSDLLYIDHGDVSDVRYNLFDGQGRLVYSSSKLAAHSLNMLDVSIYDSGIYFLYINQEGKSRSHVERIVVE